jgi:hypothetical protein
VVDIGREYIAHCPARTLRQTIAMNIDWEKWLIGAVVAGLAILMWRGYQDRKASPQWPSVMGRVTRSKVTPQNQMDPHSREWQVEVNYTYTVNGLPFKGNRIRALLPRLDSEAEALAIQQRFPEGAEVPVYYDPGKPQSSVLISG